MRLIDADALLKEQLKAPIAPALQGDSVHWRFMALAEKIKDCSTVDAVPIVRCKDCKWRHNDNRTRTAWKPCDMLKGSDDWFCADGEREKDG